MSHFYKNRNHFSENYDKNNLYFLDIFSILSQKSIKHCKTSLSVQRFFNNGYTTYFYLYNPSEANNFLITLDPTSHCKIWLIESLILPPDSSFNTFSTRNSSQIY